MEITVLYALILLNVIGAFVNPGVSKSSITFIISSKKSITGPTGNICRKERISHGSLINPKLLGPLQCSIKDPPAEIEVVSVSIESLQESDNSELDEETFKEGKLNASYIVLAILSITFASNQWSRQALYYLCDFSSNSDPFKHINAAVNFNKEQYASLASFGFTVVFAFVSLFAGAVSDRFDRNVVMAISCGVWSVSTALQGFATGFQDLVPLRAIIGASQAFFNPAAYTLLSDIFPKKMIGSINGIFSGGVYLGGALASLSILLDGVIGWRDTLFVIGGIGVATALLCQFFVSEPRSLKDKKNGNIVDVNSPLVAATIKESSITLNEGNAADTIKQAFIGLKVVVESNEAKYLFAASVLRFCAGFSIAIWKAPFVFAKFPESATSFAGSNAAIVALGGLASSLLGGILSDYLANPKVLPDGTSVKPRARAWVPAVGSFLAAPFWAAFIMAEDPVVAAACLLGEYLTAECWFGPTLASLFSVVPKDRRGTAQGLFSVLTAVGNSAPVIVGAFAGGQLGTYPLGNVLIVTVSGAYVLSGLLFVLAALADDKNITAEWEKKKSL